MSATLLKLVRAWYRSIDSAWSDRAKEVSTPASGNWIHRLILTVLWILLCEQRQISVTASLYDLQIGDRIYERLIELTEAFKSYLGISNRVLLANTDRINVSPEFDRLIQSFICSLYTLDSVKSSILPGEILGQTYELLLTFEDADASSSIAKNLIPHPVKFKKNNGVYYTPAEIVHYIIQQTVQVVLPQTPKIRILDPTCGSGAFLLAAYQAALDWQLQQAIEAYHLAASLPLELQQGQNGQWQLTQITRASVLTDHIYGVDLDPIAVQVTQLSLGLKCLENLPAWEGRSLPDLSQTLRCGNALIHPETSAKFATPLESDLFNWQQAFPEVLHTGGFDVVIGNPPYIDSETMAHHLPTWRHYCNQHYRTIQGNWDLFCVFIEQALNLCREGGLSSLVVPNKLASAHYADRTRQFLTQHHTLRCIRDYSSVSVFDAAVYPLVYVAEKMPPTRQPHQVPYQVPYQVMQTLGQVQQTRSLTITQPRQPWLATSSDRQTKLLHRLQQEFPPLATLAKITGAATVGEAYALHPLIQECPTPAPGDFPIVNSGTIDRYRFLWGQKPMRYLGHRYHYPIISLGQVTSLPVKRQQQAQQPKIIVAGMSQRLEAALDLAGGILAGKSTSIIWLNPPVGLDLRYLLGLLNSQLLSFFFTHWFQGNRLQGGYFRIGPPQLRQLPCCLPDLSRPDHRQEYDRLITLVDQALIQPQSSADSKRDATSTLNDEIDHEIDRVVYRLYRLTSEEINAIEE